MLRRSFPFLLAAVIAAAFSVAEAAAQTVFTSGLEAPIKITLGPKGNLLVAEGGTKANSGRISIVDRTGKARALVSGLPAGTSVSNDIGGPSGMAIRGRTLWILLSAGDVQQRGTVPGTEIPNPKGPSSPILSSIVSAVFNQDIEDITSGFVLTLEDHFTLADGHALTVVNSDKQRATFELLCDFRDYVPDPVANIRPSNPFGIEVAGDLLYVVDAALNGIWQVEANTGRAEKLVTFAPVKNVLPMGPPMVDPVPDGIRWVRHQLLVPFLTGFPFGKGAAQVRVVDLATGTDQTLIKDLTTAIDVLPITPRGFGAAVDAGRNVFQYLVLEISNAFLAMPRGPGRLLRFDTPTSSPEVLSDTLTNPTSMAYDKATGEVFITELSTGRIMRVAVP